MIAPLIDLLRAKGRTLSAAESLTGGLIAHLLVSVPGASQIFLGSAVVYTDAGKRRVLGVSAETLAQHTAVSAAAAREMALGAQRLYGSDYALAATGFAGPEGRQVGLVWLALAAPNGVQAYQLRLHGARNAIRLQAAQIALYTLYQELKGTSKHGNQE